MDDLPSGIELDFRIQGCVQASALRKAEILNRQTLPTAWASSVSAMAKCCRPTVRDNYSAGPRFGGVVALAPNQQRFARSRKERKPLRYHFEERGLLKGANESAFGFIATRCAELSRHRIVLDLDALSDLGD